jgi:hypothetical protein
MPEWWSYGLSDFLLFSPRTYYRMLEHYNRAWWPAQLLTVGLGLAILALVAWPTKWQGRIISAILALVWAWVSWAFLWKRYASINWAATYVVPVFALESLLLVWIGVLDGRLTYRVRRNVAGIFGIALFVFSLTFYPMLAPVAGRPWQQAELFGLAPDPTVLATAGLLLLVEGRVRWALLAVPVLWCLTSGATLRAMGSPESLVLFPATFFLILAAAFPQLRWRKHEQS